jgi:two-component system response regulator RegX3
MQKHSKDYGLEWPDGKVRPRGRLAALGAAQRRVLVLEPDPLDASMLLGLLGESSYTAVLVSGVVDLLSCAAHSDTHAVLVEVDLHGVTAHQVCDQLRESGYRGPLIFLSRRPDPAVRVAALRRGADDFVVKPYDPHELVARLEAVARRTFSSDHLASGDVVRVGDAELAISEMRFTADGRRPVYLTPTEMRLLECLMRNRSMTIRRERLIERAWPDDYLADNNRIDVYVARLRKKIELDPVHPQYIQTVRGSGYVFRPHEPGPSLDPRIHAGVHEATLARPQSA